jgi:hypothetical protein
MRIYFKNAGERCSIMALLKHWFASWKSQPSTNTLFKNGFDAALQNAKEHYLKCIPEVIVNGLHFVEYQNGKFAFYRGTNR